MKSELLEMSFNIEEKYLYNIDINDKFFDSLKEDYADFTKWFLRKSKENKAAYITYNNGNITSFCMYKLEDEKEKYLSFSKPFLPKKRLKISTLKVSDRGKGIAKTYLKIIINKAKEYKCEEIYITLFDKHKQLIKLLKDFGFMYYTFKYTTRSNGEVVKESIYVKK